MKKKNPKIYLEPDLEPDVPDTENDTVEDNEDNESGFEVKRVNAGHFSKFKCRI